MTTYTIDDVAPIKMVAGGEVALSAAERQARADEWNVEDLVAARREKAEVFETEAIRRIAAIVPEWNSRDAIETVAKVWPAISATASADHTKAMEIRGFARTVLPAELDKLTDADAVRAVNETADQPILGHGWPTK